MGRIRRSGYLIDWWIGDHTPKHVHVYRNGVLVAKVEIPGLLVLSGKVNRKLRNILEELVREKLL
jgi:hypothetical protein